MEKKLIIMKKPDPLKAGSYNADKNGKIRKGWETVTRDNQIFQDIASGMPIKDIHAKWFPDVHPSEAEGAFNRWLKDAKDRLERSQWHINTTNVLTRKSKYLKKRLIVPENRETESEDADETEEILGVT